MLLGNGFSLSILFPLYLFLVHDQSCISVRSITALSEAPTTFRMKSLSQTEQLIRIWAKSVL